MNGFLLCSLMAQLNREGLQRRAARAAANQAAQNAPKAPLPSNPTQPPTKRFIPGTPRSATRSVPKRGLYE